MIARKTENTINFGEEKISNSPPKLEDIIGEVVLNKRLISQSSNGSPKNSNSDRNIQVNKLEPCKSQEENKSENLFGANAGNDESENRVVGI